MGDLERTQSRKKDDPGLVWRLRVVLFMNGRLWARRVHFGVVVFAFLLLAAPTLTCSDCQRAASFAFLRSR